MTYYVCFTTGLVDCTPETQTYGEFEDVMELAKAADEMTQEFVAQYDEADETTFTRYRMVDGSLGTLRLAGDASMLNCRLCAATVGDALYVLDVVGMTEAEYEREAAD